MRLNKYFMLGLAGCAFAACSNEDVGGNQFPEGSGAVTIRIESPALTKALGESHKDAENQKVPVTPKEGTNVTITLTGEDNYNESVDIPATAWGTTKTVTFWNVKKPTLVTVVMNGGQQSYAGVSIVANDKNLQEVESVAAYGETSVFELTGNTSSPKVDDEYQGGYNSGDEKKTYQMYKATVQLAIPVARLEVGGITHITTDHTTAECKYTKLTIAGVYMDKLYATGEGVAYSNSAFPVVSGGTVTNYCWKEKKVDADKNLGIGIDAILKDAIGEGDSGESFLENSKVWPANNQVYGYNFFGADGKENLPIFKIYFSESTARDRSNPLPAPRFAMIMTYKTEAGDEITKFEPGHIYCITSAKLQDKNIIGDEEGNTLYGVEVTVKEAVWKVETITADWAAQ